MPVIHPPRLGRARLAHAVAIALLAQAAPDAHAQRLPARANVEATLHGGVERAAGRDRHVLAVSPDRPAVFALDGPGRVLDLELVDGAAPRVWASQGGALLVERPAAPLDATHWTVDTLGTGARWAMLEAGSGTTRATVHTRIEGSRGGHDPWQVPVPPRDPASVQARPGRRDHVLPLAGSPARYALDGQRQLRFDLWRAQLPRLLPADATWARVEIDGRPVFEGRLTAPPVGERLYETDGCAQVLELAGRLRIDVPEGARELTVHGEAGLHAQVLAPLPGTPSDALPVASDPLRDRIVQRPGESLDAAFHRAAASFPDPRAQAFLSRYAFYRPVAVEPLDGASLQSRLLRPRYPDLDARPRLATNAPRDGASTVSPLAFHWLAPGQGWRLASAPGDGVGLVRVSVAHPAPGGGAELELRQAGEPPQRLRLVPSVVAALAGRSSDADPLLAVDPDGAPIVDAAQAVLPRSARTSAMELVNTGRQGVWIAVGHRVPAVRRLADAALGSAVIERERLQDALLGRAHDAPPDATDRVDRLDQTRQIDQARRLLRSRAQDFAEDACASAAPRTSDSARDALAVLARVGTGDPLLARCAALRAAASAPGDPAVAAAFDRWVESAGQPERRTGWLAWALQAPAARRDPSTWARLAEALRRENEHAAAALADRAAGRALEGVDANDESDRQLARRSAGAARLRTDRGTEVAYAVATQTAAEWSFDRPGRYLLELRSRSSRGPMQSVRLRSGEHAWTTLLPAPDAGVTALRDVTTDAAPGLAVRIAFEAVAPGQALAVEAVDGAVLARVESVGESSPADPTREPALRRHATAVDVADACRVDRQRVSLPIHAPLAPAPAATMPTGVRFDAAAPLLADTEVDARPPETATQAALRALRSLGTLAGTDRSAPTWSARDAQAHADIARAFALRDRAADAPSPGVFAALEQHVRWDLVVPTRHGGIRLREVADGRSGNPVLAQRERLAGIDSDTPFVLRAGQGWVLEGLSPGQPVRLTLRHRAALAGGAPVALTTTAGVRHRVDAATTLTVTDTADADGELHLRVGDALPGTFLTLSVADAAGKPLDGRRPVRYFRGPLRITMTRPGYLRVVEWDGTRSLARAQWVPEAGSVTIAASGLPGAALRVSTLVLDPVADAPLVGTAEFGDVRLPQPVPTPRPVPPGPVQAPTAIPTAAAGAPWPAGWPQSGAEDGTWGLVGTLVQRSDSDDPEDDRERFAEVGWRYRYRVDDARLWGRLDVIGRRHPAGYGVVGLEHALQWRQLDGPWGASVQASAWTQRAGDGLASRARAFSLRPAVEWSRRRDHRWREEWELGLRWRDLSLRDVPRALATDLDNDVYSRYRDRHRDQLDLAYRLSWRARYDTEWVFESQAASNRLSDFGLDSAGVGVAWRWARHGWAASAGIDVRQYQRDADRRAAYRRERIELGVGRLFLGHDHGWRVRVAVGYDTASRQPVGTLALEWFDHDGRGLSDWLPSELFLREVTDTDLHSRLLPPDDLP